MSDRPRATPRVCFRPAPVAEAAALLIGSASHCVLEDFSQTAIALCFSEADAKRVAEALNNAAGRAGLLELRP